jgi:hypothetical protein
MPNADAMLIVRPRDCRYCEHGYYALGHAVSDAVDVINNPEDTPGLIPVQDLTIYDLAATDAERTPVINAIREYDPLIVNSFGHGTPTMYTGNSESAIIDISNVNIMAGRMWHTLSCLCGQYLGAEMIRQGGLAFLGYTQDWVWAYDPELGVGGDPQLDTYAWPFFESDNQVTVILSVTHDPGLAYQWAYDTYEAWIDYWLKSDDRYAAEVAKWLIWDRDAFSLYTSGAPLPMTTELTLTKIAVMASPLLLGAVLYAKARKGVAWPD